MFDKIKNKINYLGASIAVKVDSSSPLTVGIAAVVIAVVIVVLAVL